MQIKTGLTLGAGMAVGTLIGMCISEDTKRKFALAVKKKLIFALTGEEWKPKKGRVVYRQYSDIHGTPEKSAQEKNNAIIATLEDFRKKVLTFSKEAEAREFLEVVQSESTQNHVEEVSAEELMIYANRDELYYLVPPVSDLRWTNKQIQDAHLSSFADGWEVIIADPIGQGG